MIDREQLYRPPTKSDAAYEAVRNEILLGHLAPGVRLDPNALADRLALSVTPLREALRQLEAEYLVIRNAHREIVVAPVSGDEAQDLAESREALDIVAIRLACERMTREELGVARALVQTEDEALAVDYLRRVRIPVSSSGSLAVNRAFHRMLYCGSHNTVLIQYRDELSVRTERYVLLARRLGASAGEPHRQLHEAMLEAIDAHDVAHATELMASHYHEPGIDIVAAVRAVEASS